MDSACQPDKPKTLQQNLPSDRRKRTGGRLRRLKTAGVRVTSHRPFIFIHSNPTNFPYPFSIRLFFRPIFPSPIPNFFPNSSPAAKFMETPGSGRPPRPRRRPPGFVHLRPLGPDPPPNLIQLTPDRLYTVGRNPRRCDILLPHPRVSRRHCQLLLDSSTRTLQLFDGFSSSTAGSHHSTNGVFVNGRRLDRGVVAELLFGDEVLLGCGSREYGECGFLVERIVFMGAHRVFDLMYNRGLEYRLKRVGVVSRAAFLLRQCRMIMRAEDPVAYLRSSDCRVTVDEESSSDSSAPPAVNAEDDSPEEGAGTGYTFFLNRLQFMPPGTAEQSGVTLPELFHPVDSLTRVFVASFTYDISWFLSCCRLPSHLPITVACHNAERCWSARPDSRTSTPFPSYPNLLLVFPPFPEVIAFGKDRKKQGVACHHPKLMVLQRVDRIRVVVTSANLNSKQWNHVTNTIWWQDFPSRKTPDYSVLFATLEDSKSDFVAQLAGFIATLISDVPSQANWIAELTKYDFGGAFGHLVASVPGLHAEKSAYYRSNHYLSAKESVHSASSDMKFIGSVQASVVGLSHRFRSTTDLNGAQLKMLASYLRKYQDNNTAKLEVILKRSINIPADANAVSVHVAELDEFLEGDCIQLGFLPRDVAKWVSPLNDDGFFSFSAFIYPKEALAAAFDGSNMKVQLLLHVAQGPKFSEMSKLIQPEHIAPLCSLLASLQKCLGLWRLQEVLSQYKWPESLETDFVYGCSSIGTSVNAQFLASFSAATGKRSFQISESEESDPEWGRWNAHHEIQNPSMKILFPTIERVKNGACGIPFSRRMISFSEQTWQRMRSTGIFHDAIPHPRVRAGYPTHVKIARRRFRYKTGGSSFGWIYCGSHNFSPAAWGHRVFPSSEAKMPGDVVPTNLGPRLHICNYELGIILIAPPSDISQGTQGKIFDLDDIILPFVMPAPKYRSGDRPATPLAMREALVAMAALQRDISQSEVAAEEIDEDIPVEEVEALEASGFLAEEKEEEKIYAEMLWSQVDSSES